MHKPPDGTEIEFRMTAVFHNENGQWKVVQQHASVGVPNEALQRYAVKATP
jgi:ketosteroid isomerase-like protein